MDLDAVEVRTWASLSWEMCSADLLRCRVGAPFDGGFGRRRDRVTIGKLSWVLLNSEHRQFVFRVDLALGGLRFLTSRGCSESCNGNNPKGL